MRLYNFDQITFFELIDECAELMLLGFISLLLTVLQGSIVKICVPEDVVMHLLPCSLSEAPSSSANETAHASPGSEHHRRLLAEEAAATGYCSAKVISLLLFFF